MPQSSVDIRKALEDRWNELLPRYANLFSSSSLSGSSPPSVFVGSHGYPKVRVGPMVPPIHGDTSLLDSPEKWTGKTLEEIINYRLNLVRGVRVARADEPSGRYIEELHDVAMSENPADSEIEFEGAAAPVSMVDGYSAPFGPVGQIRSAKFSNSRAERHIEKAYYDRDMTASEAVLSLYNSGVSISRIQRCFSVGMVGRRRKLVPTRWSITATDDIISKHLIGEILEMPQIDSYRVFTFGHLGNLFSVVLFPHRWIYEMIEAWYSGGVLGFGSDYEDARGIDHPPAIAGAYFAARLAVGEYLAANGVQAGVLVLREIRPEYSIPVGVWQIREGIREAMRRRPIIAGGFDTALEAACAPLSISAHEWLSKGSIRMQMKQRSISEYF